MHAFVARLPQTSQSGSAVGGGRRAAAADKDEEEVRAPEAADAEGTDDETLLEGGSADSADAEARGEAGANADAAGEGGGGGEEVVVAGCGAWVDETVAELEGFSPFFFVMVGCLGYRTTLTSSSKGCATTATVPLEAEAAGDAAKYKRHSDKTTNDPPLSQGPSSSSAPSLRRRPSEGHFRV